MIHSQFKKSLNYLFSNLKYFSLKNYWPPFIFIIIAILFWSPVVQNISSGLAGMGGDPYQTAWRFARFQEEIFQGSLSIQEETAFPNLSPLPWIPLTAFLGEIEAYNIIWLFSGILAGWFGYALARQWGAGQFGSILAGIILEISPYRVAHSLGHFGAMQIWWFLAAILCVTLWINKKKTYYLFLVFLTAVGLGWTDHQQFIGFLAALIVFAAIFWRELIVERNRAWKFILTLIVAGVFIIFPYRAEFSSFVMPNNFLSQGEKQRERFSADLKSIFLPASFSIWRQGSNGFGNDKITVADKTHTLGIILPLVTIISLLKRRPTKTETLLITIALLGFIFSLGSIMRIENLDLPLPGYIIYKLPLLSSIRTAGRFILLPLLALTLFISMRWNDIFKRNTTKYIFFSLMLLEIIPPFNFPVMQIAGDDSLNIARRLQNGGVMEIPSYTNYYFASERLYHSVKHGYPLVANAALGRITNPETQRIFNSTPGVRDLAMLRYADFSLPTVFGQQIHDLAPLVFHAHKINNIVLYLNPPGGLPSLQNASPEFLTSEQVQTVRFYLINSMKFAETEISKDVLLYLVPDAENAKENFVVMEGRGWNIKKRNSEEITIQIENDSEFYAYAARKSRVILSMKILSPQKEEKLTVKWDGGESSADYIGNDEVKMIIEIPEGKITTYRMSIDGEGIMVQNPRVMELK